MSSIVDQNLDLFFLRKLQGAKLTDSNIKKRMICSRSLLSKQTQKTSQTELFSEEKKVRVKNTQKDVVHIPNKTWKVEFLEERLF